MHLSLLFICALILLSLGTYAHETVQIRSGVYLVVDSGGITVPGHPSALLNAQSVQIDTTQVFCTLLDLDTAIVFVDDLDGESGIRVSLTDSGRVRLARATRRYIRHRLATVFENTVLAAPVVMLPITGGAFDFVRGYSPQEISRIRAAIVKEASQVQLDASQDNAIRAAISILDRALLRRNVDTLGSILHDSLRFIHSNGWKQTKADVLADIGSGKLVYYSISVVEGPELNERADMITSTRTLAVSGLLSGTAFSLSIRVTEQWKQDGVGWKLIFRESVKIP